MESNKYDKLIKYEAGRIAVPLGLYIEYETLVYFAKNWYEQNKGYLSNEMARRQIREEILKEVKSLPHIKSIVNQKSEIISNAIENLKSKNKEITSENIASYLGIGEDKYFLWMYDEEVKRLLGLDCIPNENVSIEKGYLVGELNKAFNCLSKTEKMVIDLFYYEGFTLDEMVYALDMSRKEIASTHAIAIGKLKEKLGKYIVLFSL